MIHYASDSEEHTPLEPLQTFFVTFGQKYRTEPHPTLDGAHPDGVVECKAVTEDAARTIITDKLGHAWSAIYHEDNIDLNNYPLGIIASI